MIIDAISGRYWPVQSFWHNRDPRVKLAVTIILLILMFGLTSVYALLAVGLTVIILFISARLPLAQLFSGLKSFRWLILFTFVVNLVFVREGHGLWGVQLITVGGARTALIYAIRLMNLLSGSIWLMMTVRPLDMVAAIQRLFSPFQRFVPVGEFALAIGLAIRFFPLLLEESEEIALAQKARGADKNRGLKSAIALITPLFVGTIRRAQELAYAMEARGYQSGVARTDWRFTGWRLEDSITLLSAILFAFIIWSFSSNL
jgi:energy-coupling factor transport system permease protein